MITARIQINGIRKQVDAAEAMQEADKTDDAKRILLQLAREIIDKLDSKVGL